MGKTSTYHLLKKQSLTFLFCVFFFAGFSQESSEIIDSLKLTLKKVEQLPSSESNDTLKIKILEELVENIYEDEVWIIYNKKAKFVAQKLLQSKNQKIRKRAQVAYALAINDEGIYESNKGNNVLAKELFYKSTELLSKLQEDEHYAMALNNLGYAYKSDGDLVKALDFYLQSLKIREKINDLSGIAMSLNNIGLIYDVQGDLKKAKEYYLKCTTILEKSGDKYQLSSTLNNLANIYSRERYFNEAIEMYARSKVLQKSIGDINGEAYTYVNMGTVYESLRKNDEAITYYQKGYELFKSLNFNEGIAWAYINLGKINFNIGNFKKSKQFLDSALILSTKISNPELIQRTENAYYILDSAQGNFAGAFQHYKNYIFYRDSITNKQSEQRNLQQQLNYEFDKKEAVLKEQQLKDKLVSEEKSRKQRLIIVVIIIVLVLVFFFTLFILRTLNLTKKQKAIIEKQKELVETKQKEILDSIHYAKRIQDALLTSQTYIARNINRLKNNL